MSESEKYLINGVEAVEGTPLTKDQLKSIQVDKVNNPDKQYPDWVEKEFTARKDEVATAASKPIVAATARIPSRSPHPPKTDKFAPKAQQEEKTTPVLTPAVESGQNFSNVFPKDSAAKVETGLNPDGSRSISTTFSTGEQVVASINQIIDNITKGSVEEGAVGVRTTTQSGKTEAPTDSSAERSGTPTSG